MNLQKKTLLVFTILLCVVLAVLSIFISAITLSNYSALEQQYIGRDLDQAQKALDNEIETLSTITSDWGPWDDTYSFVLGTKTDYVQANLLPETYQHLILNVVIIADANGNPVYAGLYDKERGEIDPVPESVLKHLSPGLPLMNMSNSQHVTAGVLMLPDYPMLVASRPIIHTDFTGEPVGVVIMGRYLDSAEMSRLDELINPSLKINRIDDSSLSSEQVDRVRLMAASQAPLIETVDNYRIAGYGLIRDIYGDDALILSITEPRDIYGEGVSNALQFIFIILGCGSFLGLVVIILLNRWVLSRLEDLRSQVHSISHNNRNFSQRVEMSGGDEFTVLSSEINSMLGNIEKAHNDLIASETRFREMSDLLPQIIFELDNSTNLTYINKYGLEMFGLFESDLKLGLKAQQFMAPEDHTRMEVNLKKRARGEIATGEVYTLITKDKKALRVLLYTSPIIHDGRVEGFRGSGIDISKRLELEETLLESQEYLQTLLSSVQVGILVIDAEMHTIIDANPAASALIGASREDLIGISCHKYVCPPEGKPCPITDLCKSVDNAERILLTTDGKEIPIIKYVVPVMLHGRECLLETFIDNSDRKKMEDEIRGARERLLNILRVSPVGVFETDPDGYVLFASESMEDLIGRPFEEIKGRHWSSVLLPEDQARLAPGLRKQSRERGMSGDEGRIVRPDGSMIWVYGQSVTIHNPDGTIKGHVAAITDISERKAVEDELARSEEKYRALAENIADVIFSLDSSGTFTYISPLVSRYGYSPDEIIGKSFTHFIHPDDRQKVISNYQREMTEGVNVQSTFRVLDKEGQIWWLEESSTIKYHQSGNPTGLYGILRDVTDLKRAADAIELSNKKLILMNDITRHDILNTITGLFGLVDMANVARTQEERVELLVEIKDLGRIIQRQIAFTREYQEVGVNLPRWQCLFDLIDRVWKNFTHTGISINIELEGVEIYADPLLEKVIHNLFDNAVRYGNTITKINFYYQLSDNGLLVICEDDGVGIPNDQKNYIFDRGIGRNTGMGMFLTREILAITGITIRENGMPGQGARFEILVPRGTFRLGGEIIR